jgi:hypothetical protein
MVTHANLGPGGGPMGGFLGEQLRRGRGDNLSSLVFHIANFHGFVGTPVLHPGGARPSRVSLVANGWRTDLDCVADIDGVMARLKAASGARRARAAAPARSDRRPGGDRPTIIRYHALVRARRPRLTSAVRKRLDRRAAPKLLRRIRTHRLGGVGSSGRAAACSRPAYPPSHAPRPTSGDQLFWCRRRVWDLDLLDYGVDPIERGPDRRTPRKGRAAATRS